MTKSTKAAPVSAKAKPAKAKAATAKPAAVKSAPPAPVGDGLDIPEALRRTETPEQAEERRARHAAAAARRGGSGPRLKVVKPPAEPDATVSQILTSWKENPKPVRLDKLAKADAKAKAEPEAKAPAEAKPAKPAKAKPPVRPAKVEDPDKVAALLKMMEKGCTYKEGCKFMGWSAGNGRFSKLAEAAGYKWTGTRGEGRELHMTITKA